MTTPNPVAGELILSSSRALLASLVRTFVPYLVGVIVKALAHINVVLDGVVVEQLVNGAIAAGFGLVYYGAVRALELFKSSKFGFLLGIAKAAPVYVAPAKVANEIQPDAAVEPGGRHAAGDL